MLTTYDAATQMRQSQVQQLLQLLWSIPWKPTEAETLPKQMALASLLHVFLSVLHKMSYESVCLPFSAVQTVQTVSGGTKCNSLLSVENPLKRKGFGIFVGIFLLYPTCIKPRPQSWATHRIRLTLYFVSLIHHFFVILDSLGIYVLWITKKELKLSANRNKFVSGINLGRK